MTTTPMMKQYQEAKRACPEALLLFRMGDFYEMFFEDAERAAHHVERSGDEAGLDQRQAELRPLQGQGGRDLGHIRAADHAGAEYADLQLGHDGSSNDLNGGKSGLGS